MKDPRQHSEKHLDFVRSLPCIVCGDNTSTEAAHIRYGDPRVAKRRTGMGEKPHDRWTIPLCGEHHRLQHKQNENLFWFNARIDPILSALALWAVTGNHEAGEQICSRARG